MVCGIFDNIRRKYHRGGTISGAYIRGGFAFDGAILNRHGAGTEAHNLGSCWKYVGYCFGWAYQLRAHLCYYNCLDRSKSLECQFWDSR